jgi:hypothetical protein
VRYAFPIGDDPGITNEEFDLLRPRFSGDFSWEMPFILAFGTDFSTTTSASIVFSNSEELTQEPERNTDSTVEIVAIIENPEEKRRRQIFVKK